MEYNAAAGIGLTDSRKTFLEYRPNLDSLYPSEGVTSDGVRREDVGLSTTGGGIYAITENDSLRLFTLGSSTSRGVSCKEWEILSAGDLAVYGFDPVADVIAFDRISRKECARRSHMDSLRSRNYERNGNDLHSMNTRIYFSIS